AIFVLLPIPARLETGIEVRTAVTGDSRSASALEGQRLHNLYAIAAAEGERSGMSRGCHRIAPEQQPLCPGPDAVNDAPIPVLAQKVAVAVTEEAARSGTELHQAARRSTIFGLLLLADVGLVVRHSHVFAPIFGRDFDRHARTQRDVQHAFIHSLGVHVDLDFAPASRDALEDHL